MHIFDDKDVLEGRLLGTENSQSILGQWVCVASKIWITKRHRNSWALIVNALPRISSEHPRFNLITELPIPSKYHPVRRQALPSMNLVINFGFVFMHSPVQRQRCRTLLLQKNNMYFPLSPKLSQTIAQYGIVNNARKTKWIKKNYKQQRTRRTLNEKEKDDEGNILKTMKKKNASKVFLDFYHFR